MSTQNEFIAYLYNQQYPYKTIQEKYFDEFGTEITIDSLRKRVERMKKQGTLDYIDHNEHSVDILTELETEVKSQTGQFFKVGVLDSETTGLWADFGYVLCAVIKELGTEQHHVLRLDECESYKDRERLASVEHWRRIDGELVKKIRSKYDEFDIIIGFNSRNFDIKFLNTRLIKNGLDILPEKKHLDIYQIAKTRLRLRSKRLDALREFLEVDNLETGHQWEYWQMAANGVKEGFDFVVDHCKRDVDRLARVAYLLKPLINYIRK
jgi:uncharacterized protein YprB with RNaseH-like and TPR domain